VRRLKLKKCKRVHSLHFAPDGRRLLAVGGYEVRGVQAAVWLDPHAGAEVRRLDVLAECAAVTPDLTRLALGGAHHYETGESVQWADTEAEGEWVPVPVVESVPENSVFGLAFDAGGTRLAVGYGRQSLDQPGSYEWDYRVAVWRFDPPGFAGDVAAAEGAAVLAFGPDGRRLAFTGGIDGDPAVYVHDLTTGGRAWEYHPKGTRTRALTFDTAGRLAVANARTVSVLAPDGGEPLFTLPGHTGQVNAVALSPDGRHLLTASHDGAIRIWDAATGSPVKSFDWGIGPVTAVAFAPDGLTCAAAGLNGRLVLWDVDG